MYQCLDNFFCLNNAWFDRPFHLCIVELSNQVSMLCRSLFPTKDMQLTCYIRLNPESRELCLDLILWWRWHNGHYIGYDKKMYVFYLFLFITYWCYIWQYFFFCSFRVIALAYCFGKMAEVTAIMDTISLWFSAMDNYLLHESGHSPADKIEERITNIKSLSWSIISSLYSW